MTGFTQFSVKTDIFFSRFGFRPWSPAVKDGDLCKKGQLF